MKHLHWLLAIAAPLLVVGSYWFLVGNRTATLDWLVLAIGVAVGLIGIWSAPWRRRARIGATLAYVPMMAMMLAGSVLFLECSTGNCL